MSRALRSSRWPFALALVASLALVAGGVVLASVLRIAACPLCIVQRMLYLVLAVAGVLGLVVAGWSAARRAVGALMATIAGVGAFVAGYQVWLQRVATDVSCAQDQPWWERLVDRAGEWMPLLFRASGLCSDPAWTFLGLSIAEWSLAAFSGLILVSLYGMLQRD